MLCPENIFLIDLPLINPGSPVSSNTSHFLPKSVKQNPVAPKVLHATKPMFSW